MYKQISFQLYVVVVSTIDHIHQNTFIPAVIYIWKIELGGALTLHSQLELYKYIRQTNGPYEDSIYCY